MSVLIKCYNMIFVWSLALAILCFCGICLSCFLRRQMFCYEIDGRNRLQLNYIALGAVSTILMSGFIAAFFYFNVQTLKALVENPLQFDLSFLDD